MQRAMERSAHFLVVCDKSVFMVLLNSYLETKVTVTITILINLQDYETTGMSTLLFVQIMHCVANARMLAA